MNATLRPVVAAVACAVLLPGCASIRLSQKREEMKAHVGRDIRQLVSEYGPPSDVFQNGETRVVRWVRVGKTVAGAQSFGRQTYAASRTRMCAWWFDVAEDGKILASHVDGDGC